MPSLNRVFLIGHLTRNPDLRFTPKGTAVAELALAINRTWTDETGQRQEETTFVDVTLWNRVAEIAQQYLRKGSPVFIEGRLWLDTWELGGQKRSRLRIVGEHMRLLGTKEGASAPPPGEPLVPPSDSATRSGECGIAIDDF